MAHWIHRSTKFASKYIVDENVSIQGSNSRNSQKCSLTCAEFLTILTDPHDGETEKVASISCKPFNIIWTAGKSCHKKSLSPKCCTSWTRFHICLFFFFFSFFFITTLTTDLRNDEYNATQQYTGDEYQCRKAHWTSHQPRPRVSRLGHLVER